MKLEPQYLAQQLKGKSMLSFKVDIDIMQAVEDAYKIMYRFNGPYNLRAVSDKTEPLAIFNSITNKIKKNVSKHEVGYQFFRDKPRSYNSFFTFPTITFAIAGYWTVFERDGKNRLGFTVIINYSTAYKYFFIDLYLLSKIYEYHPVIGKIYLNLVGCYYKLYGLKDIAFDYMTDVDDLPVAVRTEIENGFNMSRKQAYIICRDTTTKTVTPRKLLNFFSPLFSAGVQFDVLEWKMGDVDKQLMDGNYVSLEERFGFRYKKLPDYEKSIKYEPFSKEVFLDPDEKGIFDHVRFKGGNLDNFINALSALKDKMYSKSVRNFGKLGNEK